MNVSDAFSRLTPEQAAALTYFRNKGWSATAAPAIVATLSGESGPHLNTGTYQGEGGVGRGGMTWDRLGSIPAAEAASGIANWNFPRARLFSSYAKANNLDPNDRASQFAFVDKEARDMGLPITSDAPSNQLTHLFTGKFEIPAVNNGAQRWANFSGVGGGPHTSLASMPVSAPAGGGPVALPVQAPQQSPFADVLADIAAALARPKVAQPGPPGADQNAFGTPQIGSLLYGTHPSLELA